MLFQTGCLQHWEGGVQLSDQKIVEMIDMIFKFIMGCQRKGGAHYMSVCHTYINSNKR